MIFCIDRIRVLYELKCVNACYLFFSSRRRHTRFSRDWSSDVCSSDLRSTPTKTERQADASRTPTTRGFLSSEVSIEGDLSFRNELLIDGKVNGKINATGTLIVGKSARIRGEVRAKSVTVQGRIDGNVFAS